MPGTVHGMRKPEALAGCMSTWLRNIAKVLCDDIKRSVLRYEGFFMARVQRSA